MLSGRAAACCSSRSIAVSLAFVLLLAACAGTLRIFLPTWVFLRGDLRSSSRSDRDRLHRLAAESLQITSGVSLPGQKPGARGCGSARVASVSLLENRDVGRLSSAGRPYVEARQVWRGGAGCSPDRRAMSYFASSARRTAPSAISGTCGRLYRSPLRPGLLFPAVVEDGADGGGY